MASPLITALKFPVVDNGESGRHNPLPADATIFPIQRDGKTIFRYRRPGCARDGEWKRPMIDDRPCPVTGDVVRRRISPGGEHVSMVLWKGEWVIFPSVECFQEWTLDSVCPTPDGDIVEPDHPDSWLSLARLI